MKVKNLILCSALALSSLSVSAQTDGQTKEAFKSHWFIQLQGGGSYTVGEAKFKDLLSPAFQVGFGYQFCPIFAMRFTGSGYQSKGGWCAPKETYKYRYVAGNLDFMFNLTNLFFKYNPDRIIDVNAFVGGALNYAFHNGEANDLYAKGYNLEYNWTGKKLRPVGRGGVAVDFKVSKKVSLGLEGNVNILSDKYNSKNGGNPDIYYNALVGVKFSLGKSAKKVVEPTPVEEAAPVEEKVVEPAPVEKVAEPAPVVKEPYRCDIFFKINSVAISKQENAKLEDLVKYMKENSDSKVVITGYADAGTGSKAYNLKISKKRSDAVQNALINKFGIDASRISNEYKGDTVQPFSDNDQNRVSICIAE
jgi:outer membrane protein OmpA-like peptidoglycan-associated protein